MGAFLSFLAAAPRFLSLIEKAVGYIENVQTESGKEAIILAAEKAVKTGDQRDLEKALGIRSPGLPTKHKIAGLYREEA